MTIRQHLQTVIGFGPGPPVGDALATFGHRLAQLTLGAQAVGNVRKALNEEVLDATSQS